MKITNENSKLSAKHMFNFLIFPLMHLHFFAFSQCQFSRGYDELRLIPAPTNLKDTVCDNNTLSDSVVNLKLRAHFEYSRCQLDELLEMAVCKGSRLMSWTIK